MTALPRRTVLTGDARAMLQTVPTGSVDMVLTSPPYFRLRDYGMVGQLGSETTVGDWATTLLAVTAELGRVLTPTGSLWLNLGDSYAAHDQQGARRKSLLLGPERVALTLIADGWLLRNKLIWQKPNPMPSSVRDRLTCGYELVYVLTRSTHYYFDLDSIRQPHRSRPTAVRPTPAARDETWRAGNAAGTSGLDHLKAAGQVGHPLGKNPGDVWTIANRGVPGQHHATFPVRLATQAILAGCPAKRCSRCRAPWRQELLRVVGGAALRAALAPTCRCDAESEPGLVLDPFMGSGTTAVAAEALGRDWLGIELNPAFADLTHQRVYAARAGPRAA